MAEPTPGSLEAAFDAMGIEHARFDLRQILPAAEFRYPFVARPLGYTEMKAPWAEVSIYCT